MKKIYFSGYVFDGAFKAMKKDSSSLELDKFYKIQKSQGGVQYGVKAKS